MASSQVTQVGIGPTTALFLVFLVLKLCKVISWSWWWVFSPIWGTFALVGAILVGAVVWSVFKK